MKLSPLWRRGRGLIRLRMALKVALSSSGHWREQTAPCHPQLFRDVKKTFWNTSCLVVFSGQSNKTMSPTHAAAYLSSFRLEDQSLLCWRWPRPLLHTTKQPVHELFSAHSELNTAAHIFVSLCVSTGSQSLFLQSPLIMSGTTCNVVRQTHTWILILAVQTFGWSWHWF